ncbi:EF-hand domain-containing protein [Phyllobacterium sp. CCNWLW109]|uniref:EF-hand domain-containing protein n=1 Tax=Phyllobacterium sp. CCNWLW109 TaxID=3127479 RepID=UPI003FCE7D4B
MLTSLDPRGQGGLTFAQSPELREGKGAVAIDVCLQKTIRNELSKFGPCNSTIAIRVYAVRASFQAVSGCHLKPAALSRTLKDGLCLSFVEHTISICVHAIEQSGARRLQLAELKRSVTILIHLAEDLTELLSLRRTSATSREDKYHAGKKFRIHSIYLFSQMELASMPSSTCIDRGSYARLAFFCLRRQRSPLHAPQSKNVRRLRRRHAAASYQSVSFANGSLKQRNKGPQAMKQKLYVLIASLMAALSGPAFSVESQTGLPVLQRLDQNKDSAVTRDEIQEARGKLFARLDANGDGAIDQDETERIRESIMDHAIAMQAFVANQMLRLDTGSDGKVSADEFRARAPLFDLADRDGDEKMSDGEFLVIRRILFNR